MLPTTNAKENVMSGRESDYVTEANHQETITERHEGDPARHTSGYSIADLNRLTEAEHVSPTVGEQISTTVSASLTTGLSARIGESLRRMAESVSAQIGRIGRRIGAGVLRGEQALSYAQSWAKSLVLQINEWLAPHMERMWKWWGIWVCGMAYSAVECSDTDFLRWFRTSVLHLSSEYEEAVALALWRSRWQDKDDPVTYLRKVARSERQRERKECEITMFGRKVSNGQQSLGIDDQLASRKAPTEMLSFSQPLGPEDSGELLDTLASDEDPIGRIETRLEATSILQHKLLTPDMRTLVVAWANAGCSLADLPRLVGWDKRKVASVYRQLVRRRPQLLKEFAY